MAIINTIDPIKIGSYLLLSFSLITFLAIIPMINPGTILFINISIAYIGLIIYASAKNIIINEAILFVKFDNVPINAKGTGINNSSKRN